MNLSRSSSYARPETTRNPNASEFILDKSVLALLFYSTSTAAFPRACDSKELWQANSRVALHLQFWGVASRTCYVEDIFRKRSPLPAIRSQITGDIREGACYCRFCSVGILPAVSKPSCPRLGARRPQYSRRDGGDTNGRERFLVSDGSSLFGGGRSLREDRLDGEGRVFHRAVGFFKFLAA